MWDAGCKQPTQETSGRSRCFCGVEIDIAGTEWHAYAAHMGLLGQRVSPMSGTKPYRSHAVSRRIGQRS